MLVRCVKQYMKARGSMATALCLGAALSLSASAEPELMPYLGQAPPGLTPELFAPGIVSTDAVELNSVFTPDGREFFFPRLSEGPDEQKGYPGKFRPILHHMTYEDGVWTEPRPLRLFLDAPHAWGGGHGGLAGWSAPLLHGSAPGGRGAVAAVGREHPVETGQMDSRLRHQGRQPGDKVERPT